MTESVCLSSHSNSSGLLCIETETGLAELCPLCALYVVISWQSNLASQHLLLADTYCRTAHEPNAREPWPFDGVLVVCVRVCLGKEKNNYGCMSYVVHYLF